MGVDGRRRKELEKEKRLPDKSEGAITYEDEYILPKNFKRSGSFPSKITNKGGFLITGNEPCRMYRKKGIGIYGREIAHKYPSNKEVHIFLTNDIDHRKAEWGEKNVNGNYVIVKKKKHVSEKKRCGASSRLQMKN